MTKKSVCRNLKNTTCLCDRRIKNGPAAIVISVCKNLTKVLRTQLSSLMEEERMVQQQSSSPLHSFMSELLVDRPESSNLQFLIIDDNAKLRRLPNSKACEVVVDNRQPPSKESRWDRASITLGESTSTTTAAPITKKTVQSRRCAPPLNHVQRADGRRVRADTRLSQPKRKTYIN
jgi:hypothetical protein